MLVVQIFKEITNNNIYQGSVEQQLLNNQLNNSNNPIELLRNNEMIINDNLEESVYNLNSLFNSNARI